MVTIRQAQLDDTHAIGVLFRERIAVWQRLGVGGHVESLPYDALTIYERWTHGGPWMSDETAAIHMGRLLRGIAMPFVAEDDGALVGYAEVYPGDEPAPVGRHLHIAHLLPEPDSMVADALIGGIIKAAREMDLGRVTVGLAGDADPRRAFYDRYGFTPLMSLSRYGIAARMGQGFYKINDHRNAAPAQIDGWQMSVGRTESARYHWETLFPRHWEVIPQVAARRTYRLHLVASGQEAFVVCQQGLYTPRTADVSMWSPRPLTSQLLTAIRDWAHRQDFRTLTLTIPPESAKVIGADPEIIPFAQQVWALDV